MYKLVCVENLYLFDAQWKLEKNVNDLIREGWVPQGGVSVCRATLNDEYSVCQAMVKEENE